MKRKLIQLAAVTLAAAMLTGCAAYSHTGAWAPNGVNYTIARDRQSGDLTDYVGLSWQLK